MASTVLLPEEAASDELVRELAAFPRAAPEDGLLPEAAARPLGALPEPGPQAQAEVEPDAAA